LMSMSMESPSVWFAVCKFRAMPRVGRSDYINCALAPGVAASARLGVHGKSAHDPSMPQWHRHAQGGPARMRTGQSAHRFRHVWRLL